MMKQILALLTVLTLLLGCAGAVAEAAPAEGAHQIETKTVPALAPPQDAGGMSMYFVDGAEDLPYIDLKDWADFMNGIFLNLQKFAGMQVTFEVMDEAEKIVGLKRENGHMMIFDFAKGQIVWDDYLGFLQGTSGPYMDMSLLPETDAQGQPVYLKVVNSRERHGNSTKLELSEYYGVEIIAQDELYLVPMQTLSAFTLRPLNVGLYYNQQCLIISQIQNMKNIKLQLINILYQYGVITDEALAAAHQKFPDSEEDRVSYYMEVASQSEMGQAIIAQINAQFEQTPYALYAVSSPKGNRSEALAAYGYGELCMELDFFYGLKDAHHISKFSDYFMQIGKSADLLNPDPLAADQVIFDMASYWFDDGHSGSVSHSYLVDSDTDIHDRYGFSLTSRANLSQTMTMIRAQYPESQLPYYEVGNTAYVTFDQFVMNQAFDYYAAAEKGEMPDPAADTLSLAYYAHQQITRENSPIENVVLDLSANGGGMAPTALWMVSWFLGEAQISVYHTATGAESTVVYRADVNFDHQYDEKDTISHLNLYCLASPQSFSCGNLVPWAFKADGRVTLLGRVSGGGACSVDYMTTAWGTSYQLSSPNQLSFVKNGSYYDVDQGAEPDVFIRDFRNFYDRNALTEIINGLH